MDNSLRSNGGTAVATEDTIRLTVAEVEAAPALPEAPTPVITTGRLLSLDAYRGLIMITLAAAGFGLAGTATRHLQRSEGSPEVCRAVHYQFEHVEWT